MITLADSNRVEIRAHRAGETAPAHHFYPVLSANTTDWSESADGLLTIRRVDLSGEQTTRWLRVVQPSNDGPAWFSNVIGLLPQSGGLVAVDAELKRGVRVDGRIDQQVPRPVKHGRIVGKIAESGNDGRMISYWEAAADVAPDGTFVLPSLPSSEYLQLTAMCDGWVSRNPADEDLGNYAKQFDDRGANLLPTIERFVCAQVFPLRGERIEPTIEMQRTATCEVTVLDENEHPVPAARVRFPPHFGWFYGIGIRDAQFGLDRLSIIQDELNTGARREIGRHRGEKTNTSIANYTATTDARGIAIVSDLPAGLDDGKGIGMDVSFRVECPGYFVVAKPLNANYPPESQPSIVLLKPGQTSQVTVYVRKSEADTK